MGKGGELWDDSALVDAFDRAMSTFKEMHCKSKRAAPSGDGKTEDASVTPTTAEEEAPITAGAADGCREEDANCDNTPCGQSETQQQPSEERQTVEQAPLHETDPGKETHVSEGKTLSTDATTDADGNLSSSQPGEYNELLRQYYELEEKSRNILEQLQQTNYWNYQAPGYASTTQQQQIPVYSATAADPHSSTTQSSCCNWNVPLVSVSCCSAGQPSGGSACMPPSAGCSVSLTRDQCPGASTAYPSVSNFMQAPTKVSSNDDQAAKAAMMTAEGAFTFMRSTISGLPGTQRNESDTGKEESTNMGMNLNLDSDLVALLNSWYAAGFYTCRYLMQQSTKNSPEEEERLRKEKEEKRVKEEAEKQAAVEKGAPDASRDVDSKETQDHVQQDENKVAEQHDGHATDHDNHVTESGASVEQHGSVSKDGISAEAGTVDELPQKDSAAPTLEKDLSSDNPEGLSREELGRMVASRWTGESVNEVSKDDKKGHEDEQEIPEPAEEALEDELEIPEPAEENYGGYHSEVEDDRHKYEDEEFDHESEDEYVDDHDDHVESYRSDDDQKDLTEPGHASWLDKIQQTVQNVFQKFNFFKTPVDLSEASRVRKEYDDASSKLSKIQSKISSLAEKLKHDFGKDKEFYSFYDQCFETKEGKYTYKVCAYKKASQAEGHSSTNLGRWDKFEESYRVMHFSNGDKCWNGPDRSLKVRLRCGLSNELNDVDEPSRCEYVAVLSTPAVCVEEKLKELQNKLDAMSSKRPGHDEL